jgi:hypothetical protein
MAAKTNSVSAAEDQIQCYDVETYVKCVNCALMEEQLHSALQELKSAEAIISLRHEDMKNTSHMTTADPQTPAPTSEASGYNRTSENWTSSTTIKYIYKKKTRVSNTENMEHSYIFVNHFAPLSNLNENQQEEMEYTHNCELPQSTQFPTGTTSQQSQDTKIPMKVNGRIIVNKEPRKQ